MTKLTTNHELPPSGPLGAATSESDALVDRIHERNRDLSDNDVLELAYQELDAYRAQRDAD